MHLVVIDTKSQKGKTTQTALLQDSYEFEGKIKTRTIAKLIECYEEEIQAIQLAFENKELLLNLSPSSLSKRKPANDEKKITTPRPPFAAVWMLASLIKKLALDKVLGSTTAGKLSLMQTLSHLLEPTLPPLSEFSLQNQYILHLLDLPKPIKKEDLKNDLIWLARNKSKIETRLYKQFCKDKKNHLFFYDISSSYFHTRADPLEIFAPCPSNKKQTLGLLCNKEGIPLSACLPDWEKGLSIFDIAQATGKRLGAASLTFLCSEQNYRELPKSPLPSYFLSSFIEKKDLLFIKDFLLKNNPDNTNILQAGETKNFFLYKSDLRAAALSQKKMEKKKYLQQIVAKANKTLSSEKNADLLRAKENIQKAIETMGTAPWLKVGCRSNEIFLYTEEDTFLELEKLEGWQAIASNLPEMEISTETLIQRRYDLKNLEDAFRNHSPGFIDWEISESSMEMACQGHSILLTLAYILSKYLQEAWSPFSVSPEEGLSIISHLDMDLQGKLRPSQNFPKAQKLLEALKL